MDKKELLKYYFGYNDFRPGQDKVIDNVILNKDTIGIFFNFLIKHNVV